MKNKFAIVTGSSTGIGQAIAIELAAQGIQITLVGRSEERLLQTKNFIHERGGLAEVIICDLSKIDSVHDLIKNISRQTDHIDILVNVAGIWHGADEVYAGKDFESFDPKVIVDTYAVGITTPTLLSHACIPFMKSGSKILNISGTFEDGAKGWLPYFVSKRAIEDLTIGLSEELQDKNIQVNAISPSDTATDAYKKFFPQYIEEAIEPTEIAKFAAQLCAEESTVTGKVFVMKKDTKPFVGYHS